MRVFTLALVLLAGSAGAQQVYECNGRYGDLPCSLQAVPEGRSEVIRTVSDAPAPGWAGSPAQYDQALPYGYYGYGGRAYGYYGGRAYDRGYAGGRVGHAGYRGGYVGGGRGGRGGRLR